MKILYIAYSCNPYEGSEDKIGWCVPFESAKTNQVYVITKEEQRSYVEKYLQEHAAQNLHFYFVDIPAYAKRIFRGAIYSGRLNIWHKVALPIAKRLCKEHNIAIIHQITPVEFRAIGNYKSIPNIKFVCGPIAGGQNIPKELFGYIGRHMITELVRACVNEWVRFAYKVSRKLHQCDYLLFANLETKEYLKDLLPHPRMGDVLSDVAVDSVKLGETTNRVDSQRIRFLTVGRLIYLKGHSFLLDALARIPKTMDYECTIVGEGIEKVALQKKCRDLGLTKRVTFVGRIPHCDIGKMYESADVFVFPSLREATGTVIAEAMVQGLPVITINKFGGKVILDNSVSWLYEGTCKESYIEALKDAMVECITNRDEVLCRGRNAQKRAEQYTWEVRNKCLQNIYERVTKDGA